MVRFGVALGIAMLTIPAAAGAVAPGDAAKGKTVFARCMACHQTVPAKNGLGPTMHGVVGRKAGTLPGYAFSPAMKQAGTVWTADALDVYLAKPSMKAVPGSKMVFPGLPNAADRANVIAYLQTLK